VLFFNSFWNFTFFGFLNVSINNHILILQSRDIIMTHILSFVKQILVFVAKKQQIRTISAY